MVMPGFRFHPTEEELVEFYLRRKVEGKRFNVELITFLDLYRYDPWELPAMAAIGEKEWYFYVPRDRKYRNGDRPNRVTTSGYWKATGADRMIRTENFRSIGLKKTLVFYSGKAPKGIRTSWIMNEYRLPHHDTQRYQKTEISLCRVYKRAGVEDHPSLPRCLPNRPSRASSHSSDKTNNNNNNNNNIGTKPNTQMLFHPPDNNMGFLGGQQSSSLEKLDNNNNNHLTNEVDGNKSTSPSNHRHNVIDTIVTTTLGLSRQIMSNPYSSSTPLLAPLVGDEASLLIMKQAQASSSSFFFPPPQPPPPLPPPPPNTTTSNSNSSASNNVVVDDLNRLVSYNQLQHLYNNTNVPTNSTHHHHHHQFSNLLLQPTALINSSLPLTTTTTLSAVAAATATDRLWDWNLIPDASNNREYSNMSFK
ncbi:NAC domain-containing protein 35 [Senna tora]|uniref:NAC domain-containing protein 35 n=1 Tax=Senna tora TaxID=362788 RepID=A0A834XEC8_9FABA|nr:NAC domain-containing protein 35 [Senna tora]